MTDFSQEKEVIEDVASRLDLRQPNHEALETIAFTAVQHFEVDAGEAPLEVVVDAATGMGKTYILAACIEYFAISGGIRNFAIITPGRTILEKTVGNFTAGHKKSLLDGMSVKPLIITSDNFATPMVRAAMDDPLEVKLFVFTVQALTKPKTKLGRKTHKFQEGLGSGLYEYLQSAEDLTVFADEHHCYYGPSFSNAVRDLKPRILLGLTATPHKNTPEEQIIFRYPLAAAIAEKYVKTPVIVGRTDDRVDPETKLRDGVALLDAKKDAVEYYCNSTGATPVNPVMLVIAQKIDDANDYGDFIKSDEFHNGRYADAVLVVHSNAPDDALADLEKVEDHDSPVRIIISVGMLKEGWDVKNVYVIVSMRASVSDILTEQTLGRGLRLPFGKYTDVELLDTLEVVAHERYEALLKKAGVINESFIDYRTRAVIKKDSKGNDVVVPENIEVSPPIMAGPADAEALEEATASGEPVMVSVEDRKSHVTEEALRMQTSIVPRSGVPPIIVPRLQQSMIKSEFKLADITDMTPFRLLGERVGSDPEENLRRTLVSARIVEGADGLRRTELVTSKAADKVGAQRPLLPLGDTKNALTEMLLQAPIVPARKDQRAMARPIINAFIKGLGNKAEDILSGYLDRAAGRLIQLVAEEQKKVAPPPRMDEVVKLERLDGARTNSRVVSTDKATKFSRRTAYEGWQKSIYPVELFDSSTERTMALILDEAAEIDRWVRLQQNDLPILWRNDGREYNADFIAIESDGTHWVVESKMDKEMDSEEVAGKREGAKRWANYVNASDEVEVTWRYLLASEKDIAEAKGSWLALKGLGRT